MRLIVSFARGFVSILKGMAITLLNLVGRRKITLQYPYQRPNVSPRWRGVFYLPYNDEAGRINCVGCTLCAQACPTGVITMTKMGAGKHASVNAFTMDLGRCMFCNLCIEACPFDAIHMSTRFELASVDRGVSLLTIDKLAQGGADAVERTKRTIEAALEQEAAAKAAAAAAKAQAAAGAQATEGADA